MNVCCRCYLLRFAKGQQSRLLTKSICQIKLIDLGPTPRITRTLTGRIIFELIQQQLFLSSSFRVLFTFDVVIVLYELKNISYSCYFQTVSVLPTSCSLLKLFGKDFLFDWFVVERDLHIALDATIAGKKGASTCCTGDKLWEVVNIN